MSLIKVALSHCCCRTTVHRFVLWDHFRKSFCSYSTHRLDVRLSSSPEICISITPTQRGWQAQWCGIFGSRISRRINIVLSRSFLNRLSLATHPKRHGVLIASLISDRIDSELKT